MKESLRVIWTPYFITFGFVSGVPVTWEGTHAVYIKNITYELEIVWISCLRIGVFLVESVR